MECLLLGLLLSTYWNGHKDSDCYASQHCQCCLLVVFTGEQAWVFESSQGADDGELGAPEDGVGLEVAHGAMCMYVVEDCQVLGRARGLE